jgi:hypothetical protein
MSSLLGIETPGVADEALAAIPIAPTLSTTASAAHAARRGGRQLIGVRRAGWTEFMAWAAIYRLMQFRGAAGGWMAAPD